MKLVSIGIKMVDGYHFRVLHGLGNFIRGDIMTKVFGIDDLIPVTRINDQKKHQKGS